jgi:hypothetical protein
MRIIDLYPRDFYVTVELSLKEVGKLLLALEKAELKFDGKNPQEMEAVQFTKETFFTQLDALYEENKKYVT